jgi:hypothetical protein
MRRPTVRDDGAGGANFNDDSSRSNESTSVRSDFNCLYDQSFHAEDDSIALTDSNDTAVESNENDEGTVELDDPDSGSELDEEATQESVQDDETQLPERPLGRGHLIIHTSPVYSESEKDHSRDSQKSLEADGSHSLGIEVASRENAEHPTSAHDTVTNVEHTRRSKRGVFGLASMFGKASRARSSHPLEGEDGKGIVHADSLTRETSTACQPTRGNREVNIIIASDGNNSGSDGNVHMSSQGSESNPASDHNCNPGSLVEEEGKPKRRLRLFRNRSSSTKALDDDGATVSSKRSFGSRISEGSRKSLASLRSRISFRRRDRSEHRDDLDNDSVDSTSIVVSRLLFACPSISLLYADSPVRTSVLSSLAQTAKRDFSKTRR